MPADAQHSQLRALLADARAERPELPIPDELFFSHLLRRAEEVDLPRVRAGDLLLALACAQGVPVALEIFDAEFLSAGKLGAALGRIDPSPAFFDEVCQVVREKIFIAREGAEPRIAEYSGKGSLASWTQVVAIRAALDLRPPRAEQSADDLPEVGGDQDPELKILRERYGKAFEAALTQAFAQLDDEQTNLLRLQIVDGLQTAQIATLFRVDRSTIKRRLAECREQLLNATRRILGLQLGASPDSLESILRLVRSQLHVSVARLLRKR